MRSPPPLTNYRPYAQLLRIRRRKRGTQQAIKGDSDHDGRCTRAPESQEVSMALDAHATQQEIKAAEHVSGNVFVSIGALLLGLLLAALDQTIVSTALPTIV